MVPTARRRLYVAVSALILVAGVRDAAAQVDFQGARTWKVPPRDFDDLRVADLDADGRVEFVAWSRDQLIAELVIYDFDRAAGLSERQAVPRAAAGRGTLHVLDFDHDLD